MNKRQRKKRARLGGWTKRELKQMRKAAVQLRRVIMPIMTECLEETYRALSTIDMQLKIAPVYHSPVIVKIEGV